LKKELCQALNFQNNNALNEALTLYQEQLHFEHSSWEWMFIYGNMANIFFTNNEIPQAIEWYQKALYYENKNQKILFNLGVAYLKNESFDEAKTYFLELIAINPRHYTGFLNLAICYKNLKEYQTAFDTFSKALCLNAHDMDLYYNLGNLYLTVENFSYALKNYLYVLKHDKKYVKALYSAGLCYHKILKNKLAIRYFDHALSLEPFYYDCLFAKSLALLQLGDYAHGWELYHYRFEAKNSLKKAKYNVPLLQNHDVKNKIILVQGEQGYGDTIQFSRFLNAFQEAKKVYFAVREPLKELMQNSFQQCVVCTHEDILDDVEYFVSLMDLPRIFKHKDMFATTTFPYLVSSPCNTISLNKTKMSVGFCWEGNVEHSNNHNRSIPLSYFIDLIQEHKNIIFYSLQKYTQEKLPIMDNLVDLSSVITDFTITASCVEKLDYIVSIDSALIHLSGALNKKSFLLLPKYCEFRWGEKGKNNWYESVTTIRQNRQGNWDNVFLELRNNFLTF